MLAGRLKLKHVRTLAIVIATLVGLGLVALCARPCLTGRDEVPEVAAPAPPAPPLAPEPAAVQPAAPAPPTAAACDLAVLDWRGKALGADKIKDAASHLPCKINLYQDAGQVVMNRAKIDLDRDEKWDEKWTLEADAVSKEVAPADDEVYTVTLRWTGTGWAAPGAAPGPAPSDAALPTDPARPWDAVVLGWRGKPLGSEKLKDVTKGQSYKVNLYQDAGATVVDRAKVDIDRDDKWDEKWTFTGDAVTREVAPADDEVYTETWTWSGSGWTRT